MKNFLNFDEVDKLIGKANMYIRDEELLLDDFKQVFDKMLYSYGTDNRVKFEEVCDDLVSSIQTMCINSINNVAVLTKNMELYQETVKEVGNIFDKINTSVVTNKENID